MQAVPLESRGKWQMEVLAVLEATATAWARVDLSAERHVALDQQGLEMADNQEKSAEGREALKEVVRQFRTVPTEERPARIGGVIRAFQAEIDALTRRQSSAETAFLSLYRSLDDAPDPLPVLQHAASVMRDLQAKVAEMDGLKQQLADYDKEFLLLKNQDATIRRLQQQLRDTDGKSATVIDEAVHAALMDREAQWEEDRRLASQDADEREKAAYAKLQRAHEEIREATRVRAIAEEELFECRAILEQAQVASSRTHALATPCS